MSREHGVLERELGSPSGRADERHSARISNATWIALALFVTSSLLYVAVSRGVFLYGDDILMFQVTQSMVERGSVAITSPHDRGDVARAAVGTDGRGYAKYGIGQSLVAVPAYVTADVFADRLLPIREFTDAYGNQRMGAIVYGTALTTAAIGGATVALTFLLAHAVGFSPRSSLIVAGLLAFGTLLVHYSATFLSEPLTGLALTGTVYGLVRASNRLRQTRTESVSEISERLPRVDPYIVRWLAFSGFMAGLALSSRLATGVMLIAPGLWLLWMAWGWSRHRWRDGLLACIAWGVPVAIWLAGIAWYNWVRFGNVTETGYGEEWRQMTTPFATGLAGLLVSPGKGLLWYNPPLLLALGGVVWFARRRGDLTLVIVGMLAGALLLYSRYYVWYGGGVWGTRFLVPLIPLLLLPAGSVVERIWTGRRLAGVATISLATLGFIVVGLAIIVPFDRYVGEYNTTPEAHHAAIWNIRDSPIIVHASRIDDSWSNPDIAAERYASRRLAVISLVTGTAGLGLLAWTIRCTLYGSRDESFAESYRYIRCNSRGR